MCSTGSGVTGPVVEQGRLTGPNPDSAEGDRFGRRRQRRRLRGADVVRAIRSECRRGDGRAPTPGPTSRGVPEDFGRPMRKPPDIAMAARRRRSTSPLPIAGPQRRTGRGRPAPRRPARGRVAGPHHHLGRTPWQLVAAATPPVIAWNDDGLSVSPMVFANGSGSTSGSGLRHVAARWERRRFASPPRTCRSTRSRAPSRCRPDTAAPSSSTRRSAARVRSRLSPAASRSPTAAFRRMAYRTAGRACRLRRRRPRHRRPPRSIPGRLAQRRREGAAASLRSRAARAPVRLEITSSSIALGLIEAVTDAVSDVNGQMQHRRQGRGHEP